MVLALTYTKNASEIGQGVRQGAAMMCFIGPFDSLEERTAYAEEFRAKHAKAGFTIKLNELPARPAGALPSIPTIPPEQALAADWAAAC